MITTRPPSPGCPYGERPSWSPEKPRLRPARLVLAWLVGAASVEVAAWLLPGIGLGQTGAALAVAAVVAVLNALLPPVLAALRLPFMVAIGFLLVLAANALVLQLAARALPDDLRVDGFGAALVAALVIAAVSVVLQVVLGTNDDDEYTLRVTRRIARRQGGGERTDVPGIVFLEIDGLALPVLRAAMRDGIPAFRWVEKDTGRLMACSSPADCAEIERRAARGVGLLAGGGTSRGNLLSGEADEAILTVSRMDAERRANPGYRAFLANGFNVTRALVLFGWEIVLEVTAAVRAARRDVRPRGHRGGTYPLLRGAMCVVIRDLIVFAVLTDMMRGRPAVYATFASYDEVAHHSGLYRADTLEALRKLDQQFGRIDRARRYAPRPYEIVVLSDHGQTQGATFKQRNGYGLDELVERSLERVRVAAVGSGDEQDAMVKHAMREATGASSAPAADADVADRDVVVMGSGNLGLIYLMEEPRRLSVEEIDARHPRLLPALRGHPHVGWLLVRSSEHGAVVLGPRGTHYLDEERVEGEDPLSPFSPTAARHLRRADSFAHVADIMVGSFYDAALDEACAFEELISFHGGLGGPQTRAFILSPPALPAPDEPIVGAAAVHALLTGWRRTLLGQRVSMRPIVRPRETASDRDETSSLR